MLKAGVPNVEIHLYGNGRHPGDPLPDGGRMSGGLTDKNNIPFGTWQFRFIDWARDLGFLQKPGIETKAAKDVVCRARPLERDPPGLVAATNAINDAFDTEVGISCSIADSNALGFIEFAAPCRILVPLSQEVESWLAYPRPS